MKRLLIIHDVLHYHVTMKVIVTTTSDGQPSRDEEKDRRPDSSANEETTDQASSFRDECNEATDDVNDAKGFCRLDVVCIFDVLILLLVRLNVDHLLEALWLILLLLHHEPSLLAHTV